MLSARPRKLRPCDCLGLRSGRRTRNRAFAPMVMSRLGALQQNVNREGISLVLRLLAASETNPEFVTYFLVYKMITFP